MENRYKKIWLCNRCDFEYEDKYDAKNCCQPEVIYKCEICNHRSETEEAAANHFENEHYSYFEEARQVELEKAGQNRLFE